MRLRVIAELYAHAETLAVGYSRIIILGASFKREARHIVRLAEITGKQIIVHLENRSQKDADNILAFFDHAFPANVAVGTLKRSC